MLYNYWDAKPSNIPGNGFCWFGFLLMVCLIVLGSIKILFSGRHSSQKKDRDKRICGIVLILAGCFGMSIVTENAIFQENGKLFKTYLEVEYEYYNQGDYLEDTGTFYILDERKRGFKKTQTEFCFRIDDEEFLYGYTEADCEKYDLLKAHEGETVCVKFSILSGKRTVYTIETVMKE